MGSWPPRERRSWLVADGQLDAALARYKRVLAVTPRHPEALAYRGVLLAISGRPDAGLASLDQAIAVDVAYPEAHLLRGFVLLWQRRDPAGAADEFREALSSHPSPEVEAAAREALGWASASASK